MKKIFMVLALPAVLAGCSSSITNLTPSRLPRNSDGTYRIEAGWDTREHAIRPDTINPSVMVGTDFYPMKPEQVVSDRWEAFVPVPAGQDLLHYRFKFDFIRDTISAPQPDSRLSQVYSLEITGK
jgi:hypothetical protein